ncbi:Gfo/Idh/MocA family protein [Paenibacillus apiarius]|uniref:Gfo/Idh/MocA family protein n=1 Tax=Paenibacillus apiarius TaxID=46240 RepID=UPI001982528A|nr:Gfo/Idh/MocA family oxidoreductase [Paenibacillus apiarius]MBN3526609.1 Gfo/Idh/MocA family oxidoreductase [Paenibacillus apiarius]
MSVKAILLGAGVRGAEVYAKHALQYPEELQFVAVAEPDGERRASFAREYNIPGEHAYADWKEVFQQPRFADAVFICTQDRMHYDAAMTALEKGYHVLLEKPISPSPIECVEIEEAALRHRRILTICYVLRYTPFWSTIKQIIDRGDIGKVVNIQLNENVGFAHMAHSYVRGNWRSAEHSSPIILAKSCHDLDMILWLMAQDCKRLTSFGSLFQFKKENMPEGATEHCTDGCPHVEDCCYSDLRYYLGEGRRRALHFSTDLSDESIRETVGHTPYGRCVYRCDNDVVDHQVVNMEFENGATASFTLSAFTHDSSRSVQISGTRGEIRGNMQQQSFTVFDFASNRSQEIKVHDGGSEGCSIMLSEFCHLVKYPNDPYAQASLRGSVQSHMMSFAAEESRLHHGKPIEISEITQRYRRFSGCEAVGSC